MKFEPHAYQKEALNFISQNKKCALFLDCGLGKTVITLTAINDLLYNSLSINRVLIIAPLRVAQTVWHEESQKWDHLKHLEITKVLGSETERKKALSINTNIHLIYRVQVSWLWKNQSWMWDLRKETQLNLCS